MSGGSSRGIGLGSMSGSRGILNLLNSLSAIPNFGLNDEAAENSQLEQFLHHVLTNESSSAGIPPASQQVLDKLKREVVATEDDITRIGECSIEQELFELGETAVALPCGHAFKEGSILQWLKIHGTCPTCRINIREVQEAAA